MIDLPPGKTLVPLLDVPALSPLRDVKKSAEVLNIDIPENPLGVPSLSTDMFKTFGFWILVINVLKYFKK